MYHRYSRYRCKCDKYVNGIFDIVQLFMRILIFLSKRLQTSKTICYIWQDHFIYVMLEPSIENLISTILYICRGSSVTSSWQAIRCTDRHSSSGSHMSAILITSIASQNSKAQRERFIKTLKFLVLGWVSIFFSIIFFFLFWIRIVIRHPDHWLAKS